MKTNDPQNARIKHKYLSFLKEAKGRNEASLDSTAKALNRFEAYNKFRDFKQFHFEQAKGFKAHLITQVNHRTGAQLSAATLHSTLGALKGFFQWLAVQPGYKSRIRYAEAEYFNLAMKDVRVATAHREKRVPTVQQILHVLRAMPAQSEIERRDRALIAFTLLTGARDGATISFKLKHIDLVDRKIEHDARDVRTKRSKTFTTHFFPVPSEVRQIVEDWVAFLRTERLWGDDDPLFPATEIATGTDLRFFAKGLARKPWTTSTRVRAIFKDAFANAGLPYANPHSFRSTLVQVAYQLQLDPEKFKTWAQNLGHEHMLTTFSSYGDVRPHRQAEIMPAPPSSTASEILGQIADLMKRQKS